MAKLRDEVIQGLAQLIPEESVTEGIAFFSELVKLWEEARMGRILRGAPHPLIASAPKDGPAAMADCLIAGVGC